MDGRLAPGLLVAAPSLNDPNFVRALVLLVTHGTEGALGFIVNRPTDVRLSQVLSNMGLGPAPGHDSIVLEGGPVRREAGWIVYAPARGVDADPEALAVTDRLHVTASRKTLEAIGRGEGPLRYHVVLGCAGWGPGQLEAEIAAGVWVPTDLEESIALDTPLELRWTSALARLGIHPAFISSTVSKA
ncbi:MAG: YqgE/AlgH family protein [Deltaproteobacteria bacterium]|nr:YqgE/AlgH family protein [Deltaproteobacteria bacterium]